VFDLTPKPGPIVQDGGSLEDDDQVIFASVGVAASAITWRKRKHSVWVKKYISYATETFGAYYTLVP